MPQKDKRRMMDEWKQVAPGIVRDNSGRQGEKTRMIIDPLYDSANEEHIYQLRKTQKVPLVRAYESELVQKPKNKEDKQKDLVMIDVINERIPHRLAGAPQLTFEESLYVLDRSLEGYEHAYNQCGPFVVDDSMIGFTPEGEARVWVNNNFADNHPVNRRPFLKTTTDEGQEFYKGDKKIIPPCSDESDMVQNIVDVVGEHCQEGTFPQPFLSEVRNPALGFSEARSLITQTVTNNNLFMPYSVDLIRHKVRGFGGKRTVVTNTVVGQGQTTQVQPPVLRSPPPPVTTTTGYTSTGYKFNYLPVDKPYEPDVFASRVGEHGTHHGHRY